MGEVDVCSLQCFSIVAVISRTEGSDGDRRVCGPCGGEGGGGSGVLKESIWPNRVHTCHDDPTHAVARHSLLVREIRSVGVYTTIATWP